MNPSDLDARISAALSARAAQLTEADLAPASAPVPEPVRSLSARRSWGIPLLAAAAVAAVAIGGTVVVRSMTSSPARPASSPTGGLSSAPPPSPSATSPAPSGTPSTGPTGSPSTSPSGSSSATASGSGQPPPAFFALGYQPLWPFGSYQQASEWLSTHQAQGSQPWHLDAGQTALSFTRSYLGFSELDTVTSSRLDGQGAHIGVGYRNPSGALATAAVLHLVRFGPSDNSPWEVVGSDDTTFSLSIPAYGSQVSSPVTAGGRITGVDESIRLTVRSLPGGVVGAADQPIPAGGQDQPWHGTVSFTATGVLTIVASTGGHLQAVERFAIQGVHT